MSWQQKGYNASVDLFCPTKNREGPLTGEDVATL